MAGLSCVGSHERVRIAWPCENRYGCFLPAVCDGDSHCSAAACGEVRYSTTTLVTSGVSVIVSGWPRTASLAPSAWLSV